MEKRFKGYRDPEAKRFCSLGGSAGYPTPPDPYAVSQAQTNSNFDTSLINADLNRFNSSNPLGSETWSQSGMQTITGPNGQTYQVPQ